MSRALPLNALRAFECVARHLSFRGAAAELGVTPSAVSHQIRGLEEACGQELFRRRPRPLVLTAAGEVLYPAVRRGFDSFANVLEDLSASAARVPLRVTVPNAFAGRWLVPRLAQWRETHSTITLDVIGTDRILNLDAGEADIALRYSCLNPANNSGQELFRDDYMAVCRPALLPGGRAFVDAAQMISVPRIHYDWMHNETYTPTWRQWWASARAEDPSIRIPDSCDLSFREETHAIEAVLAGQGVAICSDLIMAPELERGTLVQAHRITLPGYGYWLLHRPDHPRRRVIEEFSSWIRSLI